MPVIQPKEVQKNLDAGLLHPLYCFYGPEKMKSRELLKRIRLHLFPDWKEGQARPLSEELLLGNEVNGQQVVDSAQSLTLGGGVRMIVVKEAQNLQDAEALEVLMQERGPIPTAKLSSVVILLQSSIDKRKKFSKKLTQAAALVPCEEIADTDREAWIHYLAKRQKLQLDPETITLLRAQEPWSLDLMDMELQKYALALQSQSPEEASKVITGSIGSNKDTEFFLDAFFARNLKAALPLGQRLGSQAEQALPLLGLLTWNARQLLLIKKDSRSVKLSPFLLNRFKRWEEHWKSEDIIQLHSALAELDFGLKQTRLTPTGLWDKLIMDFCS